MADEPDAPAEHSDVDVVDVRRLRALAHPLRTQIYDALTTGPATASGLAERLGESSGATSYHLRQLAEHGFVEEVPGLGTGRERWWQIASGLRLLRSDPSLGPAAREAVDVFAEEWLRLRFRAAAEYRARARAGLEDAWRGKAGDTTQLFFMAPDELAAMTRELGEVLERWDERCGRDRSDAPDGARVVELQLRAFPRPVSDPEVETTATPEPSEEKHS